jgi:hypothetical protein
MSGAAVFSNGRLIGVVSRHHRTDGPGRIAAGRVDRWAEALDGGELTVLEGLLNCGLSPVVLPEAVQARGLPLIQEIYRAQLTDHFAPEDFEDREDEIRELVAFCGGPEPYLWLQGRPWAGKTALAAWFALHPPRGVIPVWFFITARYASQSDSDAYTGAIIDQLAAIVGREPTGRSTPNARDGERRLLLQEAAERVAQDGGTLLLVVDGLDEDQSLVPGGNGPSIASLLPERLPPNVRVLVTSRPSPGVPPDVKGGHPLRHCRVLELAATRAARHTEFEAKYDLRQALSGDRLQRDLVGLLTAARGTLTVDDLRELTGEPHYVLRERLGSAFGRVLRERGTGGDSGGDVTLYVAARGYLFAHETLLAAAQDELGPDVEAYWERLHIWAESYERRGWPPETPPYLHQPYGRLVALLRDAHRATALATDARRRDRLREATGSDAACLAEIAAARQVMRSVLPDDLGSAAALAAAADLVARRNEALHPDTPAVHARLGETRRAIGLAHTVFRPKDRARALAGVARVLAEARDPDALELAEEATRLAEGSADRHDDRYLLAMVQGVSAAALAAVGREREALRRLGELTTGHEALDRKALVEAALITATVCRDPSCAAEFLRLAEKNAEEIWFLPTRVRALATVAEAWSSRGDSVQAARLYDVLAALAERHADGPLEAAAVTAVAAEVLRVARPGEAERMAARAAAGLDAVSGRVSWADRRSVVQGLVALGRMRDAQELHRAFWHSRESGPTAIAEGWARRGRAVEAWASLEAVRATSAVDAEREGAVARVVELLVSAGAAQQLESVLFTAVESPRRAVTLARATLAAHFASSDAERSKRLLREAESVDQPVDDAIRLIPAERLAALAGALAVAKRPDEAERLLEAMPDSSARAWGWAVTSMTVGSTDTGRALRLAERAVHDSFGEGDSPADVAALSAAVEALGSAGATERVMEVVRRLSPDRGWSADGINGVRTGAVAGLWRHDPHAAGRLADDVFAEERRGSVVQLAHLLVAVGCHDPERGAGIRQYLLSDEADRRATHAYTGRVLVGMVTAISDPAGARRRLRRVVSKYKKGRTSPREWAVVAMAQAALGDHDVAAATVQRINDEERRSETLAHLAAYAACVPGDAMASPLYENAGNCLAPARSLAALVLPPPRGPDPARARAHLDEAVTPEGWHHAIPVLADIEPDAVLRVRDVVFAHLGLGDRRSPGAPGAGHRHSHPNG